MSARKAIIVGSGIGGMALSVLLTKNLALKTKVYEQNFVLGGRCTSYEKIIDGERFIVDMWTHTFPTSGRAFNKIFKRAGLDRQIEFFQFSEDNPPEIWLGRKKKINVPTSINDLTNYGNMFMKPTKKQSTQVSNKRDAKQRPSSTSKKLFKLASDIFTLSRRKLRELDSITFEEWLKSHGINEFMVNILGSLSAFMFVNMAYDNEVKKGSAAGETIRCMRDWFKMITSGYPIGGSVGIVNGYRKALEDLGGSVELNQKVNKILIENGHVKGIEIDGNACPAEIIISNAGIKETTLSLVGEEHFPEDYVEKVSNLQVSEGADTWAFYSMKFGMDAKLFKAPVIFPFIWMDKRVEVTSIRQFIENYIMKDELPPSSGMYMTIPSNMDPNLCPKNKQIVNLGCIAPVESANYQKWYDFYMDVIEEVVPDFRDHVLFMDVHRTGTPLQKWTGRFKGDAVGISQSVGQVGKNRPDVKTPIKGLYLVGADVGTEGIGTELSALSALRTYEAIKGDLEQ